MMGALLILWMMILANRGPVELPDRTTIRHYGGPNDAYLDRAGTINHATEGDRRPFRGWRS